MSILCSVFGHVLPVCYHEFDGYFFDLGNPSFDGSGRAHRTVSANCERCGSCVYIGKVIDKLQEKPSDG